MTLRFSPGLQNFAVDTGSWKRAFDNSVILIYTGSQPTTPDLVPSGTLLCTVSNASGAVTNETLPLGIITLSGGTTTGDNVTAVTLNGINLLAATVNWDVSLTQTAADVALAINRNPSVCSVVASSAGAVITLTGKPGVGATMNAKTLATSVAGSMVATVTSTSFGSGSGGGTAGVTCINGLLFDYNAPIGAAGATEGTLTKLSSQTWSGVVTGAGTQTAGWFRLCQPADPLTQDNLAVYRRLDGAIATSGSQLNFSSTSLTNGAVQTVSTFSIQVPAQ